MTDPTANPDPVVEPKPGEGQGEPAGDPKPASTPPDVTPKDTPKDEPKPSGGEPTKKIEPAKTPQQDSSKAPEKYELKAKEGSFLQEGALERTVSYAKEWGLSNEEAQELLDQQADAVTDYVEAGKKQAEGWLEEAKKDKEIGGDNWSKSEALAERAYKKHVHPELNHILRETGLASHPEVKRFFARLGKGMADDILIPAGSQPSKKELSTAELLYGQTEKKE